MKATLRIALAFFSFLPLQRALNVIGLALMTLSIGLLLYGRLGPNFGALKMGLPFSVIGAVLIALVPGFAGGAALRYGTTRGMQHLRPHGRARMLAGGTMAITLTAAIVAAPLLVSHLVFHVFGLGPTGKTVHLAIDPMMVFCFVWSACVLTWCLFFFAAGSPFIAFPILAAVFTVGTLGERWFTEPPSAGVALIAGIAIWTAFSVWYMRVAGIRAPRRADSGVALVDRINPQSRIRSSTTEAQRHVLLGSPSAMPQFFAGAVSTLFVVILLAMQSLRGHQQIPAPFMLVLLMMPAMLGYNIARNARMLWLRTSHDRDGLFNLSERIGLRTIPTTLVLPAIVIVGVSIFLRPDRTAAVLLYTAELALFAACLFYAAMSLTRGWASGSLPLLIFMVLLFLAHSVVLQPHHDTTPEVMFWALILNIPLVLLLRWHARRRWQQLDWRVALPWKIAREV